jgi:catechol 2,3-dioxygenase
MALLSAERGERIVELHQADSGPARRAGLYHFAVLLPERKDLADMLLNLSEKRDSVHFDGLSDHLVSESIYIRDPDSNGIEIYRDRPRSEWKWNGDKIQMATISLDTHDLLKEATSGGWKSMPHGTTIGHIHLHVRDLAKAIKFYRDTLGLDFTASYPGAYFFSAGGYHHHIATNTWLGTGIPAASPDRTGLNHFGIELPDRQELEKTLNQASTKDLGGGFVNDPDGIRIRLYSRQ